MNFVYFIIIQKNLFRFIEFNNLIVLNIIILYILCFKFLNFFDKKSVFKRKFKFIDYLII